MTVTDAVNLLIGVSASGLAKNAAETVSIYRSLKVGPGPKLRSENDVSKYITSEDHDFGAALEFIVTQLMPADRSESSFRKLLREESMSVRVGFGRPNPSGFIEISFDGPPNIGNPFSASHDYEIAAFAHYWDWKFTWLQHPGQKVLNILGYETLSKIAQTISA